MWSNLVKEANEDGFSNKDGDRPLAAASKRIVKRKTFAELIEPNEVNRRNSGRQQ